MRSSLFITLLAFLAAAGAFAPNSAQAQPTPSQARDKAARDRAATDKTQREGLDFFEKKIRPVLVQKCYECHSSNSKSPKGGLVLDSREGLLKGGDTGEAILPGEGEKSLLVKALQHDGPKMPPKQKLPDESIANFIKWIDMGAPDPRVASADTGKAKVAGSTPGYVHKAVNFAEARQFWAYQSPRTPALPAVKNAAWGRSDVDTFILASLEAKGLTPNRDADRVTLIRRVTFDLVGLPPSPEEVDAFVKDTSSDAFAKVVDRLLASPQFGERWGRHWLDVARYAESTGKERNVPLPEAWRYRDYIIDAFNSDKPYDRFIREQIAGDLLPAATPQVRNELRIATGFLALGPKSLNEKNAEQFLLDEVDEQLDTVTRSVMATTVGCARCHDHKFDPILQSDYYALAGIFRSTETLSGVRRGARETDGRALIALEAISSSSGDAARQKLAAAEIAKLETELAEAKRDLEQSLKLAKKEKKQGDELPAKKGKKKQALAAALPAPRNLRRQVATLESQLQELKASAPEQGSAMGVREGRAEDCAIRLRGEVDDRGPVVPRGFLTVTRRASDPRIAPQHSGRKELAEWLVSRNNPLTSRVMVNRVWQHLFGTGIVETADNFGQLGERPSHPELLDYLAVRFMDQGWSTKKLIRELVLSRVYQIGSEHSETAYDVDPTNRLCWRMSRRRLDAEAIRDAILHASGQLQPERPHGSIVQAIGSGEIGRQIRTSALQTASRHRSVYLPLARGVVPEALSVFDVADPNLVVAQREVTTVATQALYLMNSPFVLEQSDALARLLLDRPDLDAAGRVALAYRRALGRSPTASEQQKSVQFVKEYEQALASEQPGKSGEHPRVAWSSFCQTLFASGEFRCVY